MIAITVTKRDGRKVEFQKQRIAIAICRAGIEVDGELTEEVASLADYIANYIASIKRDMTVEEIQDYVEDMIMQSKRRDIAKKYILYREERTKEREKNNKLLQAVRSKVEASTVEKSNANVDEYSFGGRKKESSDVVQKALALEDYLPKDVAAAHEDWWVYQHDLDSWALGMHNCLNIDFKHLFDGDGFFTRNTGIRPPTTFSTACQLVAVIMQLQSQTMYGGCASMHIDFDLAPYVRKSFIKHIKTGIEYLTGDDPENDALVQMVLDDHDNLSDEYASVYKYARDMLEQEGKQSCEALIHNLNSLESRPGSQLPFSSINYGRDTSPEGRMVTRWLLEASLSGTGPHHMTSIFPIGIFQLKDGVNKKPGDPNYDLKQLALKSLSKRIYPNICNCDWSEAHEDENDIDTYFSTMGCRTMLGYDVNGMGYKRIGRGNCSPATIILPHIGIEYGICTGERTEPDLDGFWKKLDELLMLEEKALLVRFDHISSQIPGAAPFMYNNGSMREADKCVDNVYEAMKHQTLAMGYIGLAETCTALFGKNHAKDEKVHEFALSVVKHIADYAADATERNHLNFSAYATPAENLCKTAMDGLKKIYGEIPGVLDREYLTNSHHTPVWEEVSIFDKIKIEAPFAKYAKAGNIFYIECESTFMNNIEAVESAIDAAAAADINYIAINFPIDQCSDCGYQDEFDDDCPECGSMNILQLRRVTGYLSVDYRNFNAGKMAEVRERIKHTKFTDFAANKE